MDVLGDLVARERRSGRPAVHVVGTDRSISYRDFCTTAYKAGNVLRYLGVREESTIAVAGTVGSHPLWAFYGAAQLGAVTRFVTPDDWSPANAPRVLLLPVDHEGAADPNQVIVVRGVSPDKLRGNQVVQQMGLGTFDVAERSPTVLPVRTSLPGSSPRRSASRILATMPGVPSRTATSKVPSPICCTT